MTQSGEIVIVAHLVGGETVMSKPATLTSEDVMEYKEFLENVMSESRGWQCSLQTCNGWAVFPKDSVLYISMESADGSAEGAKLLHEKP